MSYHLEDCLMRAMPEEEPTDKKHAISGDCAILAEFSVVTALPARIFELAGFEYSNVFSGELNSVCDQTARCNLRHRVRVLADMQKELFSESFDGDGHAGKRDQMPMSVLARVF